MRPSRFDEAQMRKAIQDVNAGTPLVTMCRGLGITPTTFYRWRKQYPAGDLRATTDRKVLREENVRLKQVVAELYLERESLRHSLARYERIAHKGRSLS